MAKYVITLNNNVQFSIDDSELYSFNIEDIDISKSGLYNINSKQEFLNYLKIKRQEYNDIEFSKDILKDNLNIDLTYISTERFADFDAGGYSGETQDKSNKVLLEYKSRTGLTSDSYNSIILDEIKYNKLNNLSKKYNIQVFIIYIFRDKKMRIFKVNNQEPDFIKTSDIQANKWKNTNIKNIKKQTLYFFKNERTLLI